jgi:hypothetical protein
MKRQACALTVLGVRIILWINAFIDGSVINHSWWAFFAIIPALLGFLCFLGISRTIDAFVFWIYLLCPVALTPRRLRGFNMGVTNHSLACPFSCSIRIYFIHLGLCRGFGRIYCISLFSIVSQCMPQNKFRLH